MLHLNRVHYVRFDVLMPLIQPPDYNTIYELIRHENYWNATICVMNKYKIFNAQPRPFSEFK